MFYILFWRWKQGDFSLIFFITKKHWRAGFEVMRAETGNYCIFWPNNNLQRQKYWSRWCTAVVNRKSGNILCTLPTTDCIEFVSCTLINFASFYHSRHTGTASERRAVIFYMLKLSTVSRRIGPFASRWEYSQTVWQTCVMAISTWEKTVG